MSHISEGARDLIKKILKYKPDDRISLEGILEHPWMVKYSKLTQLKERSSDKENKILRRKNSAISKTNKKPKFNRKYS